MVAVSSSAIDLPMKFLIADHTEHMAPLTFKPGTICLRSCHANSGTGVDSLAAKAAE